jgi:hypothetical protein
MDFSDDYGTLAVGHDGSDDTICCTAIRLVALPEEGMVISVQANGGATSPWGKVVRSTKALRNALLGL